MTQVFISYSRRDLAFVEQLTADLKAAGLDVWYDLSRLEGGDSWPEEIQSAIDASDIFVIIISPDSITSKWVRKEFLYASNTKRIVPLLYKRCQLPLWLLDIHFIDVQGTNYKRNFSETLRALGVQLVVKKKQTSIQKDTLPKRKVLLQNTNLLIALVGLFLVAMFGLSSLFNRPENTLEPTQTPPEKIVPEVTHIETIIVTSEPGATPTRTYTPTVTPMPAKITDDFDAEMVLVSAGEFIFGSDDGPEFDLPTNILYLNSFYIDKYEVSNMQYKACVSANICTPPKQTGSASRERYYGNPEFDEYPVINVSWYQASDYCVWRGANLPSEPQWEKAARGKQDFIYPWGNTFSPAYLNFCDKNCPQNWSMKEFDDGYADTAPVAMFEAGQSSYGAFNMSGNVYEWILDWYDVYPNGNPNADSDFGQTNKVVRGGSWFDSDYMLRSDHRFKLTPDRFEDIIGFRCARDVNP